MLKRCCTCKVEKPLECFAKSSRTKDGKQWACGKCNVQSSLRAQKRRLANQSDAELEQLRLKWIWVSMRQRCTNPKSRHFNRYGGRGICVCDRWAKLATFLADMGPRPSAKHTVERLDNDGPYSPENCKWATRTEQNGNTSATQYYVVDGVRLTLRQVWESKADAVVALDLFRQRVQKYGWPLGDALSTPIGHRRAS